MSRLFVLSAAAAATLVAAAPALAADWQVPAPGDNLRSGFNNSWDNADENDPLSFELGVRYWYSWGAQSFQSGGVKLDDQDNAHAAEAHFRIDDASTDFYAKGLIGMAFKIDGTATYDSGATAPVSDGHIYYGGADLGYSWLGKNPTNTSFGPFAGVMHWNDSPNLGRAPFTVGTTASQFSYAGGGIMGPMDSQPDNVDVTALRLGLSGKTDLGSMFDISGEVAAVPYAKLQGTLGALGIPNRVNGNSTTFQASAVNLDGWGYGAMAELMVGFHPTDNMVLRLGGRAWYLQGRADTTFDSITVNNNSPAAPSVAGTQSYISTANPWSMFRYGALAEFTYNF